MRQSQVQKVFPFVLGSMLLLLVSFSLPACSKGSRGASEKQSLDADTKKIPNLEYASSYLPEVDAQGQLVLPGVTAPTLAWSGKQSMGSSRFEVVPVD